MTDNTEMPEVKLEHLKRLPVRDGDVVVFKMPFEPSEEHCIRIRNMVRSLMSKQGLKNIEVITLGPDVEVSVLSPNDYVDVTSTCDSVTRYQKRFGP